MKLIIGLGNPGDKYKYTRHNVGFLFLDYIKERYNFGDFNLQIKFKGEISEGLYKGEKTLLLKPQTFMNLSGESIKLLTDFYKIDKEDWLVIYDDMSMDFGKLRYRNTGSAGGHNGIKDIIQKYSIDFQRIKVGIGQDTRYEVSDWVLSKFTEEELIDLDNEVFQNTQKLLEEKL